MRITGFHISHLSIVLKKPFVTALRRVEKVNDIIIRIDTDTEHVGYGEACAVTAITGTTNQDVIKDLKHTAFPSLLHTCIDSKDSFHKLYNMDISAEAKACVDIALFDLLAKQNRQSLHHYLGAQHSQLHTDLTISVNEPLAMQQDVHDAIAKGFDILKIKLDHNIEQNIERVKRINEAISDKNRLRLDPNQSLTYDGCLKMLSNITTDNIECIEQPFSADDLASMKKLKEKSIVPVLADESLFNTDDARRLLDEEMVDLLNIKLMKCGGIFEAVNIAKLASKYDKQCMIGSMLEGPVSLLAAAHFGLSQENVSMADLDSPLYLKKHPLLEPFHMHGDHINLSNDAGLGIDPIMDQLKLFG